MSTKQRTLLTVHAHPDDEATSTGGILARYGAAGVRTVLVTCTGGEVGEISDPRLAHAGNLAEVRAAELAAAIRILGIDRAVSLGYRDSGMMGTPDNEHPDSFWQADFGEATRRLVKIVREERPEIILTYDAFGGYGHPDHIRAHQIASAAFHVAADPARFPELGPAWSARKLYYAVWPRSLGAGFARAFRESGLEMPFAAESTEDGGERPAARGVPDELVTTAIDVADYWDIKWSALLAHRTQVGPQTFFLRLPVERMRELWSREYFRQAIGPGSDRRNMSETDLFEDL